MSAKRTIYLSSLAALVAFVWLSPPTRAAAVPGDSEQVSKLLSEAKTKAFKLKSDAVEMQSFALSNLAWGTHAAKITEIKEDVNALAKTATQLNQAKSTASSWQKIAIDRVNPLLHEAATNVEESITHLTNDRTHPLNTQEHKEYLDARAELATALATVISDFVAYGETKAKFEKISQKLEVSER